MQDFGLSFEMCVHGSLSKERLGEVFSITQNSSSQLRRGLSTGIGGCFGLGDRCHQFLKACDFRAGGDQGW